MHGKGVAPFGLTYQQQMTGELGYTKQQGYKMRFWPHQEKLILRLRQGRRVQTHPTSFFRPLGPQRPASIPNTGCVLT